MAKQATMAMGFDDVFADAAAALASSIAASGGRTEHAIVSERGPSADGQRFIVGRKVANGFVAVTAAGYEFRDLRSDAKAAAARPDAAQLHVVEFGSVTVAFREPNGSQGSATYRVAAGQSWTLDAYRAETAPKK